MATSTRPFRGPWIIAGCFLTFGVASGFPYYNIAFFFDYLRNDHGWTQQAITLGAPIAVLLTIWAGPLLVPRFSPRWLILVGTGLTFLAFQWFAHLGGSKAEYYAAWCVYMLGYFLSGPIAHQIILSQWYKKRRGRAMGIAYVGGALLGAMGNKLNPWLVTFLPYQRALEISGCVLLLAWPVAIFVLRDKPEDVGQTPDGLPVDTAGESPVPMPYGTLLRMRSFWLLLLGSAASIGSIATVNFLMKFVLEEQGFVDQAVRNAIWSTASSTSLIAAIAGRLLVGHLADRMPRRPLMLAIYAIVALAIPLLFLVRPSQESFVYLFAIVFGFAMGADYMLIPLMAADLFGLRSLARAMSAILPSDTVTQFWFPNLIAQLRAAWGGYGLALWVSCLMAALGAVAIAGLPGKKDADEPAVTGAKAEEGTDAMTAAMFIAQCLKHEGVTKVFGQCGHTNYALIDACHRLGIEYVSFRHEQLAVHAADAYFRVTHKLAVVNVHLSPGLTNALTGVATAAADSTPMVVFCGNTPSYHHAREPHQGIRFHADASQGDIFRPICKRVWRVDDAKFFADVMPRALNVAQTGRPGPVLIDVPMDVFSQQIDVNVDTIARRPEYGRVVAPDAGIAEAAQLLATAERPVIFAGNGVLLSEAADQIRQLAEMAGIPVATTLMGKGIMPESHPLALGMTGIWGTAAANLATHEADVVLAVGTAFGEADCSSWNPRFTFAIPPSRLIQIDIDPQEVGKIYPVEVGLVGDAQATLRELIRHLWSQGPFSREGRIAQLQEQRRTWEAQLRPSQLDNGTPIHPARLLYEIARVAPEDAIYVTDVGWNKNGAGQQLQVSRAGSFITSGGMATMGFAPGAAIGAKIGAPDRKVICLVGDGGLLSALGAFATAVELGVPVVWILFNNFCFSTIKTVGTTYFKNSYGTEFTTPDGKPYNPDFPLLAKAFGIESAQVLDPDDLAPALAKAMAIDAPYLLEVQTRGDVPMPRTGHWDIAEFLRLGND